jgi:hypothetical protein
LSGRKNKPSHKEQLTSEEQLTLLRKVAGSLGLEWDEGTPFETARLIHGALLGDYSWEKQIPLDDPIRQRHGATRRTRGRPRGSVSADITPLQALALHETDAKRFSWPRLADLLLNCKNHARHKWDSDCTVRLKMAALKLRTFRNQLRSNPTP